MLQSFTKILFSLVWWQMWHIDSHHIFDKMFPVVEYVRLS